MLTARPKRPEEPRASRLEGWTPAELPVSLPDIGELTFPRPEASAHAVFGPDDRQVVADTRPFPWRALASLIVTVRTGAQFSATGWFIGPNAVMTAGHTLYVHAPNNPAISGWVSAVDVVPGRAGPQEPFGRERSHWFRATRGWIESSRNHQYDYGVVLLRGGLGSVVGMFGFRSFSDAELANATATLAGYPAASPNPGSPNGLLWHATRQITSAREQIVFYDIDATVGQSGAPVFQQLADGPWAVALHAYEHSSANYGIRINPEVYSRMVEWAQMNAFST